MSILEHSDHRKAGRAVVIVSVMYIFLDQCVVAFPHIDLLGLRVQITEIELRKILTGLVIIYGLIFAIRVFLSRVLTSYIQIRRESEDAHHKRAELLKENNSLSHTELRGKSEAAKKEIDRNIEGFQTRVNEITQKQTKLDQRRVRIYKLNLKLAAVYSKTSTVTAYAITVLVEVVVPLAFLFVAFLVPVGGKVCPGYIAHLDLLRGLP